MRVKILLLSLLICYGVKGAGLVNTSLSGSGSGGTNGTTLTAGAGITISNNVISATGTTSNGVALTTFGYYTNLVFGTDVTNTTGYPYLVIVNTADNANGGLTSAAAVSFIINGGGTNVSPTVQTTVSNQLPQNGFVTAMIPNGTFYHLINTSVNGGTNGIISAFIYGTTTGTLPTGSGILTLNGLGTNTTLTNATSLGPLRLTGNELFANGFNPGPSFVFDAPTSAGGDQSIALSGTTNSSGAGFIFDILSYKPDSGMAQSPNGYPIADTPQVAGVPTGAPYNDAPGAFLFVSPQAEFDFGYNNHWIFSIAGGNAAQSGRAGAPYIGVGTNIYMFAANINNGTNVFARAADCPKLWDYDTLGGGFFIYNTPHGLTLANGATMTTTNGLFIKSNGTLANGQAFDSTDNVQVNLSDAQIAATNYIAKSRNSFTSGGAIGFDAGNNGAGLDFYTTPNGGGALVLMLGQNLTPQIGMVQTSQSWNSAYSVAVGGAELDDFRTWGNGIFDVHGSIAQNINTYAGGITDSITNATVLMNGSVTNTLPVSGIHTLGRIYTIKNINASTLNINTTSSQTIDGYTNIVLAKYESITVQSDGTNWQIINMNPPLIQAGGTNLSASTGVTVAFLQPYQDTNFVVTLQGQGNPILNPQVTAVTTNSFTTSMTAFTGRLNWTIIHNTQ